MKAEVYRPANKIRIVTAASLFDGHDAAINIMRRVLQASGAEVIHLGHDRSAQEVVRCAIQEDVQAIALTSYQGGHMEFFKYVYDLLQQHECGHIKIFGGGGGVILPKEIEELHRYGIARIYSPDDGRKMGLQGMINDVLRRCDFPTGHTLNGEWNLLAKKDMAAIARLISAAENFPDRAKEILQLVRSEAKTAQSVVLGVTGTGGSGKSSLVDELVRRFLFDYDELTVAILSVDPTKRKTGGALLGDRIRMNAIHTDRVYMRSMATRQAHLALSRAVQDALAILKAAHYDLIILETAGIGQSDSEIQEFADVSLYVMTPEFGAASQLEKIDMLDFADVIAINKFDKRGATDALRDVRKQVQRNRQQFDKSVDSMPVYGTIASQFNDPGVNQLYKAITQCLAQKTNDHRFSVHKAFPDEMQEKVYIVPPARVRYLSEIADTIRNYNTWVQEQSQIATHLFALHRAKQLTERTSPPKKSGEQQEPPGEQPTDPLVNRLEDQIAQWKKKLDPHFYEQILAWDELVNRYHQHEFTYTVRGRAVRVRTKQKSLAQLDIPRVATPRFESWGKIVHWLGQENFPGYFPYTAGIYPFKRQEEDPTRMFAGEGGPERTNRRFHYLSRHMPAKRLSTAFDSVTLYGRDPHERPDIYGKIGNAGVSVCCLDDAKKLYSGFDLCDPKTSVSMTINGPAAIVTGFFFNAAIDQQCELYIKQHCPDVTVPEPPSEARYHGELPDGHNGLGLMLLGTTGDQVLPRETYEKIKADTLRRIRGTVQADILKEDQAQNTCIFSTEFSLRLMGDMQQYFIDHHVRNFYSVSISGYHIAEAGANPITQLALTLANGFTYVEYYLSRGMHIDDFAPNLSFFFSNGLDPEYAVIGRVARRIWAKAMKLKYGANERSQMLKYHIQTSGRSLHAQEIEFNDIRTTLQALYAIYDNCNSLHTNAYDEAITTPTEESVRRAVAIQLIINKELGIAKNENPLQGSFLIEQLTDLVEEAVLAEFDRLTERGGVLGAMETMYQRSKIQEESLYYETLKHSGAYPIVGVNTFLSAEGSPTIIPPEVIRSTEQEKQLQIARVRQVHQANHHQSIAQRKKLQLAAIENKNMFEAILEATKYCTLGELTEALFEVGGQYRRNM